MSAPLKLPKSKEAYCISCRIRQIFERLAKYPERPLYACSKCKAVRELTIRDDERDAQPQRKHGLKSG